MGAAVTFFISLFLLVAFVAFRFLEERRGQRAWATTRASADVVVSDMYRAAVTGDIPRKYQDAIVHFLYTLAHDMIVFIIEGLRAIERPLAQLSYRLRRSVPSGNGKEPSAFLKTITPERPPLEVGAKTTDSI